MPMTVQSDGNYRAGKGQTLSALSDNQDKKSNTQKRQPKRVTGSA